MSLLHLGPVFRATLRHRVSTFLIAFQVAITMAIVANSISIIQQRHALMQRDSGLDEKNSFVFMNYIYRPEVNYQSLVEADLLKMRNMPGVRNVIQTNAIPGSGFGSWIGLTSTQKADISTEVSAAIYGVDEHGLDTLNITLLAGEFFTATDMRWQASVFGKDLSTILISKAMATSMFGEQQWQQAPGKYLYNSGSPLLIKGVFDHLQSPWLKWNAVNRVVLAPSYSLSNTAYYLVRTEPGMRERLMEDIPSTLKAMPFPRMIRKLQSMEAILADGYKDDRAMIQTLVAIMFLLLLITSLGIVGLVSFNINKRQKQIGTRRALGATRGNILSYFLLENAMVTGLGVLFGALLTLALNMFLVNTFSINTIQLLYIPAAMLVLMLLGQLAVLWPAFKAASISPALATRTV